MTTERRRVVLTAIAVACDLLLAHGAAQPPPTEIIVVGTVHAAAPKYSADDLLRILQRVKPDVILYEYPADMMTPTFEFKEVIKGDLEQQAVLAYVKQSGAKVRPYDIGGRNTFYEQTQYFGRERQCNRQLSESVDKGRLGPEARKIIDALDAANARRDRIGQSDPMTINSFESDAAVNEKQWLAQQGIPEIVRLTPELRGCAAFWDLARAYWNRRNDEMLRNIHRFAAEFAGKRLVVLCGYEHRYYLRSHLYDWDREPAYVVKEYWEY